MNILSNSSKACGYLLIILLIFTSCSKQEEQANTTSYTADWESLSKHTPAPDWFKDAKLGIYFHWGVYSVPAFGSEWYPRNMHIKERPEYKHHIENYGSPAEFGYHDFVPMFRAEHFDAADWADLFQQAGARFAGPVAEHHDGFAMWASSLTPWNALNKGPGRDITGELAEELRARDMKLVTTFHHARNNQHRVKRNDELVWTGHYPRVEGWPTVSEDPELRMLYGNVPRDEFLEIWKEKLIEVIDKYQPDLMWFDSWFDEIPEEYQKSYLAYYLNHADKLNKGVVVTTKQDDLPREISVLDIEKGRMGELTDYPWLTDDTISRGSWCYTEDLEIKPTSEVLHSLIDIVSKNGVLLLNISPKADGTIPDNQRQVLIEMGAWLNEFGEAIYGTRPWITHGEGPTELKEGTFGGFTDAGGYTAKDIRFTTKDDRIYAIVLGWPGPQEQVTIQSFAPVHLEKDLDIQTIRLLGTDEDIQWEMSELGLLLTTPAQQVNELAIVFEIQTG